MKLKYAAQCDVCKKDLGVGVECEGFRNSYSGDWYFLCVGCHEKAGWSYTARKILEAWYYQFDDSFGSLSCKLDHEDYRILENLDVKCW